MTARPTTGVVLGSRYRLLERIASGGMGTVWSAEDETLHRRVAVKVLNEGLAADDRFAERFRREARASAGLSHPNVAGVFDFGEDDGRPYIVMELIEGETLAQRLEHEGRLEPSEVMRIGAAVAEAMRGAHAAGVVHRDVKPANVMLTPSGDVKVMDFGIAAPVEGATGLTATGAVMGTSRYISPEQAQGDRATPASDVYSLGVVLYEALAGEAPFVRQTPVATALAHMHERPRPLAELRPDTPSELADLVHRCLAKEPSARPSPEELEGELRRIQADVDTEPMPASGDTEVLPALGAAAVGAAIGAAAAGAKHAAPTTSRISRTLRRTLPPGTIGPDRPRRDRRLRWVIGAAVVGLVLVVAAVAISGSGRTKVPRFVGLTSHDARVKAENLGMMPRFYHVPSSRFAIGRVVEQRPAYGVSGFRGMTVSLGVSSGPDPTTTVTPSPSPEEGGDSGDEHGHSKGHDKDKHKDKHGDEQH
jgi:serine/threonine-protein kinase